MTTFSDESWQAPRPSRCPNCGLPVQDSGAYCSRCPQDLVFDGVDYFGVPVQSQCIWCGSKSNLSNEDVFPKWLSRQFPNRPRLLENIVRKSDKIVLFGPSGKLHVEPHRNKYREAYRLIMKEVCSICNNTWMSRLQESMKPIIIRLNEGLELRISDEERDTINRWIFMTSVGLAMVDRFTYAIPGNRGVLRSGVLPMGAAQCPVLGGVGIMPSNERGGEYTRLSIAQPVGYRDKPFTQTDFGWFIIERVVFAFAMAPHGMAIEYLPWTTGESAADILLRTGVTLTTPPTYNPVRVSEAPVTSASLATLDTYRAD